MIKKIISFIIFIIVTILTLYIISPIFIPKWTKSEDNYITKIVRGYYAEKDNSLDILFMGNSDMYRGMMPIYLWNEYGIASYSYTSSGQRMWTAYYVLEDALRSQNPDIIVFNVDSFNFVNHSSESCYRKAFDNMQLSLTKLKAINDPIYEFSLFDKLSFIFPVLRYHSRISELTKEDFKEAYGYHTFETKGQDMSADIKPFEAKDIYMENRYETVAFPEKTKAYVNKIVNLCKKKDIKLILVELPSGDSWSYAKNQTMTKYAKEKNLPFLDFNLLLDEMDFDWNHDTADGGDHLNIYGALKVTKYMGKYLKENYDIKDRRKDKNYADWFETSKIYNKNRKNLINGV